MLLQVLKGLYQVQGKKLVYILKSSPTPVSESQLAIICRCELWSVQDAGER